MSRNQNGEHDDVNQLLIQHNPSSPPDLVINSLPEVIFVRFRVFKLQLYVDPVYKYHSMYYYCIFVGEQKERSEG